MTTTAPIFTKETIQQLFLKVDELLLLQFEKAWKKTQIRNDGTRSLMKTTAKAKNVGCAGSTGTVLFLNGLSEPEIGRIGWVGDSRAVGIEKNGTVIELTQDHTPDRPDETERVRKAGGTVNRKGRLNNSLAVSRGFGDRPHKNPLTGVPTEKTYAVQMSSALLACPDVVEFDRKEMAIVLIASDGVWDVVSNEEAMTFLLRETSKCNVAAALQGEVKDGETEVVGGVNNDGMKGLQIAVERLVQLSIDRGSQDNVSAIAVWCLKNKQ